MNWTIGSVLQWSQNFLKEKNFHSARVDVEHIMSHVLGCDRVHLYTHFDKPLLENERSQIRHALLRRANHEPVAYIVGFREFYGHRFVVNRSTLIPRPDTEIAVERAVACLKERMADSPRVLDIGAGSGCIGITLALECPQVQVDLLEISPEAVEVIHINCENHGLSDDRVKVLQGDVFSWGFPNGKYDLIVSNPPYIAENEISLMAKETLDYEPKHALFTCEQDGLTFYRSFAEKLSEYLTPEGKLILEVGHVQADAVQELFSLHSTWKNIHTHKDYSGITRVVEVTRS